MSNGAQVVIVIVNCVWLAPITGGVSLIVGIIGVVIVLGDR